MSEKSIAEKAIKQLKAKLNTAINTRSELESRFSAQSALLTNFIGKLSQACKGTDMLLDNKLAKLRSTLKTSVNFDDVEQEIKSISTLLQKHSLQNDRNIIKIHQQLQTAITNLQKVKNLPSSSKKQLKSLVNDTEQSHSSLMQYVPIMSEFISLYESLPEVKASLNSAVPEHDIDTAKVSKKNNADNDILENLDPRNEQLAPKELLGRFSSILNTLVISDKHKTNILEIKSTLRGDVSHEVLMTKCLSVFDLIIEDLEQERSTAKIFLSTLSDTLTSVQASVSSTIANTNKNSSKNDKINKELSNKLNEISIGIIDATSLTDMKVDVNDKLLQITNTLKKKIRLEEKQQTNLRNELDSMSAKVEQLELQSQSFEKRIQEQQAKSMQDALTKLANRAAFDDYFAKEIVRYHFNKFDLAIAVVDLDNFKRINDTYGHAAGDKTLQVIGSTLTKVVGDNAFVSRYGGEEFVLIFSNIDKISVISKLNVLRKKVESLPFTFKGNRVSITLSIGVTLIQKDDNVHSAFERADTALYRAKHDGKNRVIYG